MLFFTTKNTSSTMLEVNELSSADSRLTAYTECFKLNEYH